MNDSLRDYTLRQLQSLSTASQTVSDRKFRGARDGERLLRLGTDFVRAIEGTLAETSVIERADLLLDETGPGSRFRVLFDIAGMYVSLLSEAVHRGMAPEDTPSDNGLWGEKWVAVIRRIRDYLRSTDDAARGETGGGAIESPSALTARFFRLCGWEGVRDNSPVNLPAIIAVLGAVKAYIPPDEGTSGEAVCEATLWQRAERGQHRSALRFVIHELEGYCQRFDEWNLRGSELLRRCRPELLVGPDDRDHLKSALWEDTSDKARILTAVAESALAAIQADVVIAEPAVDLSARASSKTRSVRPLKPGELAPDQDPDIDRFHREPLTGDMNRIAKALHAAGLITYPDPKHLKRVAASGAFMYGGGGKMWRVYVKSKKQYDNALRELDKIKPASKSRS